ncbi:MAG: DNA replication protein [Rhodoplanes sp.]|nr:DNA replication protein [Rhodoplanes sp.]
MRDGVDAGTVAEIGPFRAKRLAVARRPDPDAPGRTASAKAGSTGTGPAGTVLVNEAESPLAWLARRKGRDGRRMIEPEQFLAGERLRADFTFAQLGPRLSVDWSAPLAAGLGGGGPAALTDAVIAARQRLAGALAAAGAEFSGLLLDVCCFLKGLEDVERERGWPPRSAKVVLQLGLDRLARHYGLGGEARGRARVPVRAWRAEQGE